MVSAGPLVTTEGGLGASFDAVLASTPAATVEVEVKSGDPTEGLVFAPGYAGPAASREITFTPQDWDVPRRVVVQPVDDATQDGSVTYPVSLRVAYSEDAAYAAVPRVEVGVTNLDDDAPGIIVVPEGGAPLRTAEDGTAATFTIWLACAPTSIVQLPVTVGDTTEGLLLGGSSPYVPQPSVTVTFTPLDWATPQTITVVGRPEAPSDGAPSYLVTVGPSSGAPAYAALPARAVEVVNAPAEWFASSASVWFRENEVIDSRIDVAGGPAALSKVFVWVNIAHPWDGDLVLTLVSPNGASVRLANHEGGQGDDFRDTVFSDAAPIPIGKGSGPFAGTYIPAAPLSQLAGGNANGTWTLRVVDEYVPWYPFEPAHGGGTLMRWALHLE